MRKATKTTDEEGYQDPSKHCARKMRKATLQSSNELFGNKIKIGL